LKPWNICGAAADRLVASMLGIPAFKTDYIG
jgi:hypothetical protein